MPMDAGMMAGGGMPPQQPQGQQPQTQIAPGQTQTGDPQKIIEALKAAVEQAVNSQGYVDLNKLVLLWPQISQRMGINIPFQTVMQIIQQNPNILEDLINRMGLAGIIKDGRMISSDQLLGMGSGAVGGGA